MALLLSFFLLVEHVLPIIVPDRQAISGQLEPARGFQSLEVTLLLLPDAFWLTRHQGAGDLAGGKPVPLHFILRAVRVAAP